jgi:tripartite-type tricarboxylate transporter receptor subunit TctC
VRDKLAAFGVESMVMTPKEFGAYVEKQAAADAALVKAIGVNIE